LLNHADFFKVVAEKVRIYYADVAGVDESHVLLHNGESIPCEALLCGTGWVPSLHFFTPELSAELGLPNTLSNDSNDDQKLWNTLDATADAEVVASFPMLAKPPPHYHKPTTKTPYRLYEQIAPLQDESRSIVFIGHVLLGSYFRTVECQSMWATAYMDGKLKLPDLDERRKQVALFTAWCRRRYLSTGDRGNCLIFEPIGYADRLLAQLGLQSHRKWWWRDLVGTCWASDLRGVRDEYIAKYGREEL